MTTQQHASRVDVWKHAPAVYQGMASFQQAAAEGLDPVVAELIKIRASQINQCAYCLDMHLTEARDQGESQLRLDLVAAWEETPALFTEKERAALALTEAITLLTGGTSRTESGGSFVPDEVYERAAKAFDEAELARLIAQIVAINSWNRFQVTTRAVPAGVQRLLREQA